MELPMRPITNYIVLVFISLSLLAFSFQIFRAETLADRLDNLVRDQQTLVFSFESTGAGLVVVNCTKPQKMQTSVINPPYLCTTTQTTR